MWGVCSRKEISLQQIVQNFFSALLCEEMLCCSRNADVHIANEISIEKVMNKY